MNFSIENGNYQCEKSQEDFTLDFIVGRIKKNFLESPIRDSENQNITKQYDNNEIQQPVVPLYF